jgi:hypothetical protein
MTGAIGLSSTTTPAVSSRNRGAIVCYLDADPSHKRLGWGPWRFLRNMVRAAKAVGGAVRYVGVRRLDPTAFGAGR